MSHSLPNYPCLLSKNAGLYLLLLLVCCARAAAQSETGIWSSRDGAHSTIECGTAEQRPFALSVVVRDQAGQELWTDRREIAARGGVTFALNEHVPENTVGTFKVQASPDSAVFACHTAVLYPQEAAAGHFSFAASLPALTEQRKETWLPLLGRIGSQARLNFTHQVLLFNPAKNAIKIRLEVVAENGQLLATRGEEYLVAAGALKVATLAEQGLPLAGALLVSAEHQAPYHALLLRTSASATGSRRFYALSPDTPADDIGPLPLATLGIAQHALQVINTGKVLRNLEVEVRSAGGDLLRQRQHSLAPQAVLTVALEELEQFGRPAASVRVRGLDADPAELLASITAYEQDTDTPSILYAVQPLEAVRFGDWALLYISTEHNAVTYNRFLERSAVLTECVIYVHEQGGSLISQNELTLPPHCSKELSLAEQVGPDFFGVAQAGTDLKNGSFSAAAYRFLFTAQGTLAAVMHIPARRVPNPVPGQGLTSDPELLVCPTENARGDKERVEPQAVFVSAAELRAREKRAEQHARRASHFQNNGRLLEAIEAYQAAINEYPKFLCARINIVLLAARLKDYESAQHYAAEVLRLDPLNTFVYTALGNISMEQGQPAAARSSFQRAASIDPSASLIQTYIGISYQDEGNEPEAIAAYQRALAGPQPALAAFRNLGWIYQQQGKEEAARDLYRQATAIGSARLRSGNNMDEERGAVQQHLAFMYEELGDLDEAELYFTLQKDLGVANGAVELADFLGRQRRWEEALEVVQELLDKEPENVPAVISLGWYYMESGYSQEALVQFESALALDPQAVQAYRNMGVIYLRQRNISAAEAAFQRCLAVQPEQPWCLANLASVREQQGRIGEALQLFEQAAAVAPQPDQPEIRRQLERLQRQHGQSDSK